MKNRDYQRIETAIRYLAGHYRHQPDLEQIAAEVNLSQFHFQRLFTDWAGVSPKQFVRYLTWQQSKKSLKNEATLFDAAMDAGLSGTGRLHDLFVSMEAMTPGEFKKGGSDLTLNYSVAESPFGDVLIVSTTKGICHLSFTDHEEPESVVRNLYPNASKNKKRDLFHEGVVDFFGKNGHHSFKIKLHLNGTLFQMKVWKALLSIPEGELCTYSEIAGKLGNPKASRAVGSAVARNPVACLIPCHRVIKSTGVFGKYRWGSTRKMAIIGREAAVTNQKLGN